MAATGFPDPAETHQKTIEPKRRLLAAAIDYLAEHGIGDISLRKLATALGTSHRMLIYHFGSKGALLADVVRTVEQRQRELLAELQLDPGATPQEVARRYWQRVADPAMWPFGRLLFELYGRALQGDPQAAPLLDGIVERWLEPVAEWSLRHGVGQPTARAHARLAVAVTQGLLLDLLGTGDREAVEDAMELFLTMSEPRAGTAGAS
ncbi:MAG: TetR/AcrR family transcriptional regulator [Pseudonocardiaceae bacterium]